MVKYCKTLLNMHFREITSISCGRAMDIHNLFILKIEEQRNIFMWLLMKKNNLIPNNFSDNVEYPNPIPAAGLQLFGRTIYNINYMPSQELICAICELYFEFVNSIKLSQTMDFMPLPEEDVISIAKKLINTIAGSEVLFNIMTNRAVISMNGGVIDSRGRFRYSSCIGTDECISETTKYRCKNIICTFKHGPIPSECLIHKCRLTQCYGFHFRKLSITLSKN